MTYSWLFSFIFFLDDRVRFDVTVTFSTAAASYKTNTKPSSGQNSPSSLVLKDDLDDDALELVPTGDDGTWIEL
jgi:hypothetical protein